MITDADALAGNSARFEMEADLCIIGAGAAGLALANELVGSSQRVVVLESGRHEPDPFGEALNQLECVGLRHDGGTAGRVRALGGTTRAWGGQLIPLRASETAARDWVPHSGWPLDLDTLDPYYRRAEQLFRVPGPPYDAQAWKRLGLEGPQLDASQFCVRFSQWAALGRRNFAVMLRARLAAAANVTVLLDATATSLSTGAASVRTGPASPNTGGAGPRIRAATSCVEHVIVRSRSGLEGRIRAKAFVICCGGIETARLLLASPSEDGHGLANSSGAVGRFFQDHISCIAAEIRPTSRRHIQRLFDPRYLGRTMYTAKIEPSDAAQREGRLLNAMGHLAFHAPEALGLMEVRRLLRSMQAGKMELPSLDECKALIRGSGQLASMMLARIFQSRRASPSSGSIFLLVDVEQAPSPESRVTLSDAVDSLGMRRARLDWCMTGQEVSTLKTYARQLARELERLGLGSVQLASEPDFSRREGLGATRDIFHHMGTARMSASPREGVTNADLRCHDLDNTYIASTAVFPAGGIANPTFTLVALALRLADHLRTAPR